MLKPDSFLAVLLKKSVQSLSASQLVIESFRLQSQPHCVKMTLRSKSTFVSYIILQWMWDVMLCCFENTCTASTGNCFLKSNIFKKVNTYPLYLLQTIWAVPKRFFWEAMILQSGFFANFPDYFFSSKVTTTIKNIFKNKLESWQNSG